MNKLQKLDSLLESMEKMLVKDFIVETDSEHYPFKNKSDLGTGPRGQHHHKADKWDCSKCGKENGETFCDCEGIGSNKGHKKHVVINTAYKKKYNHEYKTGNDGGPFPSWRKRRSGKKGKKD